MTAPSYTTANAEPLSIDLHGNTRIPDRTTAQMFPWLRWTHKLNPETGRYDRRWWWKSFGNTLIGNPASWLRWRMYYLRFPKANKAR